MFNMNNIPGCNKYLSVINVDFHKLILKLKKLLRSEDYNCKLFTNNLI